MKSIIYHSPGSILKIGKYIYQDQLSKEYKEFTTERGQHKVYLMDNYKLTDVEYYFLVTCGDKNYRTPCPYCGEVHGKFLGLSKGWAPYCSQSHITKFRLECESREGRNPFQNPEFILVNSERIRRVQKSKMDNGTHHLLTRENQLKAAKNNFIVKAVGDTAILYISKVLEDESLLKYGITSSHNPEGSRYRYKGFTLYNHEILVTGSIEYIADLEYKLKLEFSDDSEFLDSTRFNEFINYLDKIK